MEDKKLIAVKLTVETVEKVLQYLSNQPYNQVVQLIDMVQKSEPVYQDQLDLTSKSDK